MANEKHTLAMISICVFVLSFTGVNSTPVSAADQFIAEYAVDDNGSAAPNGIAGYDLLSKEDKVLVFDYNGDRKDDLFLYRPGKGAAWVAKSNGDGSFTAAYAVEDNGAAAPNGIAGYDILSSKDKVVKLDYNGDGKDDLFLYRPGEGIAKVVRSNGDGSFTAVGDNCSDSSGIAGYDFLSPEDKVVVFDYNNDQKDDLFFYRPGRGAAWVAKSNGDGTFTAAYAVEDNGSAAPNGIAGYDFLSSDDQVRVVDYNRDGRDDLFFYRPGKGAAWIAESNKDGTFTAAYAVEDNGSVAPNGIAGYDFLSSADQVIVFDFNRDRRDDLFFYRPGRGAACIAEAHDNAQYSQAYLAGDDGSAGGIAGYDLLSDNDKVVAFDYNGDDADDLFLYRPGKGAAWVAKSQQNGQFESVYTEEKNGIAGYDFLSQDDQVLVLDYNGDDRDDLFFYRPGKGAAWVVKAN